MKKIIAFGLVIVLTACGFHLKGTHNTLALPDKTWSVKGDVLQQALENALRYADGHIADNAPAQLRVLRVQSNKETYTITRAAKLNENLLSLLVVAQAYHHHLAWGKPIEVEVRRVVPYSDSMILGKQEEEQLVWREMQQDAAEQIVRQLSFIGQEP